MVSVLAYSTTLCFFYRGTEKVAYLPPSLAGFIALFHTHSCTPYLFSASTSNYRHWEISDPDNSLTKREIERESPDSSQWFTCIISVLLLLLNVQNIEILKIKPPFRTTYFHFTWLSVEWFPVLTNIVQESKTRQQISGITDRWLLPTTNFDGFRAFLLLANGIVCVGSRLVSFF